jgi:tRNA(adenine34) deaminase
MAINHNAYMKLALSEAQKADEKAEIPIGAVLVSQAGDILAASHNQTISLSDPTAHAEILVLRKAAHQTQNYRLLNTILYVTIEPCVMCMGALVHARISILVYGAKDPKWGAAGSLYDLADDIRLNHRVEVIAGICEDECRALMQNFFRSKRK